MQTLCSELELGGKGLVSTVGWLIIIVGTGSPSSSGSKHTPGSSKQGGVLNPVVHWNRRRWGEVLGLWDQLQKVSMKGPEGKMDLGG